MNGNQLDNNGMTSNDSYLLETMNGKNNPVSGQFLLLTSSQGLLP